MTSAGKISLSVEIDANDLSARLGEAVRRAIAPALEEINRELEKTQREYNETARAGEKSSAAQTAGAKEVANAVQQVGQNQKKTAAQTVASGRVSAAAIRAVTRAYEHQTAAIAANTAARVANDAVPPAGPPDGGGGGGRRGPPRNRNSRTGDFGFRGGILGFLTGPTGLNTIALGAQALPAATTAITALTGAVLQLGQAGLVIPGVFGGILSSVGTAALGFHGMKDAIKALNDAAKSGDPKDLEKATEALKDMDPAAAAVAKTVSGLVNGPFKDLQKFVQGRMFAGFDKDLQSTADKVIPRLKGNIGGIADAWNATLKTVTGSVGAEKNLSLIDRMLGNTAEGQKRANAAIDPIIHAVATLASTGSEFLPRLGDAIAKVAHRFDDFISKAGHTGQLWKWIDEGLNGARAFGNALLNLGKTLTGVIHAGSGDMGFLGWLESATDRMQRFVNSTEGQNKIGDFFKGGREDLKQWRELLSTLGPILGQVLKGFATWGTVTLPIIQAISSVVGELNKIPGLVQTAIAAFLAFRTINAIMGSLSNKIGGVGAATANAGAAAGGGAGGGRGGRFNRGLIGASLLAGGTAEQLSSGGDTTSQIVGALSTIGGGALTGAALGGPIGAVIGGGVGGVLAGLNYALAEDQKAADDAAAAQKRFAQAVKESDAASAAMAQSQKSLTDSLLASGGAINPDVISAVGDQISQIPDKLKSVLPEADVKSVADDIKNLGVTTQQLASIVTGSQPSFDALESRLRTMGPDGIIAAQQLQAVRDSVLGVQTMAQGAAPLLQQLSTTMGTDIPTAAANLTNAFKAVPQNVPVNVTMPGGAAVLDILTKIGAAVHVDNEKNIVVDAPLAPQVLQQLTDLGVKVTTNNDKTINVSIDPNALAAAQGQMQTFVDQWRNIIIQPQVQAPPPVTFNPAMPPGWKPGDPIPPRAGGGIVRRGGYAGGGRVRRKGYAGGGWFMGNVSTPGDPNPDIPGGPPGIPGDWGKWWGPNGQPGEDPHWLTNFPWDGWPGMPYIPLDPWRQHRRGVSGFAGGGWFAGNVAPDPFGPMSPFGPGGGGDAMLPDWWRKVLSSSIGGEGPPIGINNAWMPNAGGVPPGLWWQYPNLQPGRAPGGVLPGYSPGKDNMMVPLSGGEGIIIPEAMRALGGDWLYNLNSRFRPGISRGGYAGGGVVGFDDGGMPTPPAPGQPGVDTTLSVLIQIRDILAGRGGVGPLAETAKSTGTMATAAKGAMMSAGGGMPGGLVGGTGPFGTPIKPHNTGYDMAAAAIRALGGDPEKVIGADPATLLAQNLAMGGPGMPGMPGMGGGVDMSKVIAALSAFARSGSLADVSGIGLNANSPVISALTSARNKKKGMSDEDIAGLVGQVLGGGFTGTLDAQNSPLIKSLQSFHDQMITKGGVPGAAPGSGFAPLPGGRRGVPMGMSGVPGAVDANTLIMFAQQSAGGKYAAASDLAGGLADCSGAVSDLVELLTQGKTSPARLFTTHNEGQVLQSLGATPGLVPGALQIGFNEGHTAATLPNGMNFESGGSGGGVVYGGPVGAGDKQFTSFYSLPVPGGAGFPAGMPGMPGAMPTGLPGSVGGAGTPVFVTNWPGQGNPALAGLAQGVAGAGISAAGQAGTNVVGDILDAGTAALQTPENKRAPDAKLSGLVREGNPMALVAAAGFRVEDFTRQGGVGADQVTQPQGPGYDATGRLFSDTSGLIDRSFTSLGAQFDAMRKQMVDVTKQVGDKLNKDALQPIIKTGMQSALDDLKDATSAAIGTAMGNAAGPPIGDAVSAAVAQLPIKTEAGQGAAGNTGAAAASPITGVIGNLFAGGGSVYGGIPGKDSVPILAQQGEWVLNTDDVAKMGGTHGTAKFVSALRRGGLRKFATGGGVNVNDTVGAEFFGVSEVPIISTIVNLLVRVLLKVIGVNIEARDTLQEMSSDFRQFRGDAFKAFDAQGRLINDTSGLIERSSTSEETAAAERIRILKIVIQAIIKYIIEKVIVPLAKAVANAAIQAGASAAGAATNAGAPGAGGIVSSLISSAGQAGVEIAAEVGTDFALAISDTLISTIAEALPSLFPGLTTGVFGGAGLAALFDPLGGGLAGLLGALLAGITGLFGGVFGGASTLIPGIPFDNGGMAEGVGYLPKATNAPELVLSPTETTIFSRFVNALERGGFGGGNTTSVHAPITVLSGGPETATQVENRLLKLLP